MLLKRETEKILNKINEFYNNGIDLIKVGNSIINKLRDMMIESKTYNKEYCDLIIKINDSIIKMEKSQNPKIIFEITILNCIIDDNNEKVDTTIKTKNIEQNIEQNKIEKEDTINKKNNNLNDLKNIRVGNTLYKPKKEIISEVRNNWNKLSDLAFDEIYGNISRILSSDIMPVAASDSNLILISKLNGIANQINGDLDTTEKIIDKVFLKKFKVICLSREEWNKYTEEYKNNKNKFVYKEENNKIEKENSLKQKAKELFED